MQPPTRRFDVTNACGGALSLRPVQVHLSCDGPCVPVSSPSPAGLAQLAASLLRSLEASAVHPPTPSFSANRPRQVSLTRSLLAFRLGTSSVLLFVVLLLRAARALTLTLLCGCFLAHDGRMALAHTTSFDIFKQILPPLSIPPSNVMRQECCSDSCAQENKPKNDDSSQQFPDSTHHCPLTRACTYSGRRNPAILPLCCVCGVV